MCEFVNKNTDVVLGFILKYNTEYFKCQVFLQKFSCSKNKSFCKAVCPNNKKTKPKIDLLFYRKKSAKPKNLQITVQGT